MAISAVAIQDQASLAERRQAVALRISQKLFSLEEAVQMASACAAELSAELSRAPAEAHVSRGYAQASVARIANVITLLADARGSCALAHAGLNRASKDLGVTLVWPFDDGFGTESTPPDKEPTGSRAEVLPLASAA